MIRRAIESDREAIALCIAEGFEKDFSVLCKDTGTVAKAISGGIQIDKFYVAETEEGIAGVAAVSDCKGRAVVTDATSYRKHFGLIKGIIAGMVLKEEFEAVLEYPSTVGYLEFVTVRGQYRRQGLATTLLKECLAVGEYEEYVLDVTDVNTAARSCYTKIGFSEYQTVPEKHPKQKGFNAKIYMKYKPAEHFPVDCEAIDTIHLWKGTEEQLFQKEALNEKSVLDLIEEVLKGNSTKLVIDYLFQGEGIYVKKLKKKVYTPYHCYLVLHHVEGKRACLFTDGNVKHGYMLVGDFETYNNVDCDAIRQIALGEAILPEYGIHYERKSIDEVLRHILSDVEALDKRLYDSNLWSLKIPSGDVGYQKLLQEWGILSERG